MRPSANIIPLALVGLVVTGIVGFLVVVIGISWFSSPPFGLGNAPSQPIAFPHSVHAGAPADGGAGIQCEFCHRNVTKGDAATVPALEQCSFCHQQISGANRMADTSVNLDEIAKLNQSFAGGQPVDWERVHRVPDHVRFVHEAHVRFFTQGDTPDRQLSVPQTCSVCHGDVANAIEVQPKPGQSLKMGTCVDCHRQNNAPTDCTICHK